MLKKTKISELWLIWSISFFLHAVIFFMLNDYLEGAQSINKLKEPPVLLRTILYILTIVGFLIIKLVRHIMVHLSKTMSGDHSAKHLYFKAVLTSMMLTELLAIFAVILVFRQDEPNNLYIFAVLFYLAMVVYRPNYDEYLDIVKTLNNKTNG